MAGRGYQFSAAVLAAAEATPPAGNLPVQATRFFGRGAEFAAIGALLQPGGQRLLTLTGTGGIGKTRLRWRPRRPWPRPSPTVPGWLELAPVLQPHAVAPAVAGALGVPQQAGRTLLQSLVDALRRRQLVLVLDNCEHVVDEAAALAAALLAGGAQLTLLATSREALNVAGEQAWPVPPTTSRWPACGGRCKRCRCRPSPDQAVPRRFL